ncbi:MAG TPA: amidohydrolase family protein [Flavobacterium sp.]|nr:amidohydrolase family protein [Flavobacterium sp.]
MRKSVVVIVLVTVCQMVFAQKQTVDYVVKNVSVVPMNSNVVLKNQDVLIVEGKIIAINKTGKVKVQAKQTIEGKGKFILPTLADAHVHLPEKEEELDKFFALNLLNGVTKLRSMRGIWEHKNWKEKYNSKESLNPKLYLSAPPISRNYDLTEQQIIEYVKAAKENGFDIIKMMSIKNEALFVKFDSVCKAYDMKIAGHFISNPKGVVIQDEIIFKSNFNSIEHLGGLIGEPEKREARIQAIKENDIYVCPTLLWYQIAYGLFDAETITKISGMEFYDQKTKEEWLEKTKLYREKTGSKAIEEELAFYGKEMEERLRVLKQLEAEGILLLLSPDSSSKYTIPGFSVLTEIQLYKKAGLSNFTILQAATVNFANYFKEITYGIIEKDKTADFILVNENPLENLETLGNIQGVFYKNQFLNQSDLEELAKKYIAN